MSPLIRRFVAGMQALPRFPAGGKAVSIGLGLLIGIICLVNLAEYSAAVISHRSAPGVVRACEGLGTRTATCTVEYALGGHDVASVAEVDATGVSSPREGERVDLWLRGSDAYVAGGAFAGDVVLSVAVLFSSLVLSVGCAATVVRAGRWPEGSPRGSEGG